MHSTFRDDVAGLFHRHFARLYRYLDRLSGDPELATDLAQEAFVRLYQRASLPDSPEAWLITVATNLFRNAQTTRSRRARLLTAERSEHVLADPPASPAQSLDSSESQRRVRRVLDLLAERDRCMLLLLADGCSYRDIAIALDIRESSVGTLLSRAKQAFRERFEGLADAP